MYFRNTLNIPKYDVPTSIGVVKGLRMAFHFNVHVTAMLTEAIPSLRLSPTHPFAICHYYVAREIGSSR